MKVIDYLNRAYHLDQQIACKLEQVSRLRSLTQKVTASYGDGSSSHAHNNSPMEDAIVRLVDAEDELATQVIELVDVRMEIAKLIDRVPDALYKLVLEKRYLCFMTWERIAADMNWTYRWTLSVHGKALGEVEKLLEADEAGK